MNRYWTLSGKPLGSWPEADTFVLREGPTPKPGPGQALTRTLYISLDPYQWGYKKRGVEPPGAPCHARTVAQVVESRMDGFQPGDLAFNTNGWSRVTGNLKIRVKSCHWGILKGRGLGLRGAGSSSMSRPYFPNRRRFLRM
jgi:NADPH-dependent curcumin reductase CurA